MLVWFTNEDHKLVEKNAIQLYERESCGIGNKNSWAIDNEGFKSAIRERVINQLKEMGRIY